jgi:hypothetical protein
MKLLGILAAYLGATALLFGGLAGGVMWLVKPDPTGATPATRVAPISPRIAESIERKMAVVPPAPAAQAAEAKVEPASIKPVMREADVALTHTPRRIQLRELTPPRTTKRKPAREEHRVAAHEAPAAPEAAPARVPVATVRTDFPY